MEKTEKKRLIIFIAIAFGVTYLMGIPMYFGFSKGADLSVFPMAQMLYPAVGVMTGMLLTSDEEKPVPKPAFILTIIVTVIMMLISLISVAAPADPIKLPGQEIEIGIYNLISQYLLIPFSLAVYIILWVCGKERRINSGFERANIGKSALMVCLFIVLYFARVFISFGIEEIINGDGKEQLTEWLKMMAQPVTWINIAALPVNFFFVFLVFLGEEYGWRYYLQPVLQKKFGLRGGIFMLGLVWGLWHLPIDFMYYTKDSGPQLLVNQIITCTAYAIFFGYAYMKTNNIWVAVILHFLNNNMVPIIQGNYSPDVLENNSMSWSDLPIAFVLMILYFLFIFAKPYRKSKAPAEQAVQN